MKIIIAGSRTFKDYELLKRKCDQILKNIVVSEIISGGQVSIRKKDNYKYGADYLGELYAKEKGYLIRQYPADWSIDKTQGIKRNIKMGERADAAIIFWDGWSKGSKHMISVAEKNGLKLRIIRFDPKIQVAYIPKTSVT